MDTGAGVGRLSASTSTNSLACKWSPTTVSRTVRTLGGRRSITAFALATIAIA